MQEATIYLAMDGTVFNNELDCIEYELKHDLEQNGITFFSAEGREIIDATMAYKIIIECDEVPESLLDAIYSYCGATELPETKGTWLLQNGEENRMVCNGCPYHYKGTGGWTCQSNNCHEFEWFKVTE